MTTLMIHTSLNGRDSLSSELASQFARSWAQEEGSRTIRERDLAAEPIPHLDAATFRAFTTPPDERTAAQAAAVDLSDRLIEELRAADLVVLGLPMYNFGVPSTLKAWFDHVARAGVTFRYTSDGPEGLLKGKRAIIFATRGGRYAGTESDTQTPYVRQFLAFLGIDDVEFIHVEGTAMGEQSLAAGIEQARNRIQVLQAA